MKLENQVLFSIQGHLLDITHLLIRHGDMLSDIQCKLNSLETRMTDITAFVAQLNAAAEDIRSKTSLLDGIVAVQNKIFEEVNALLARFNVDPALQAAFDNLHAALEEQTPAIATAIALNTKIDSLNPDLVVDETGVVVATPVVEEPAPIDPSAV